MKIHHHISNPKEIEKANEQANVKENKPKKERKISTPRKKATSQPITLDSVMQFESTLLDNLPSHENANVNEKQLSSITKETTKENTKETVTENINIHELDKTFTKPIKTIFHISDLHIQLYKRHQEYLEVFARLFNYLKTQKQNQTLDKTANRNIPMICVITGDLLHSKSDLSPECIQLTYNFIKTLASILPVVIIPGNHDININNRERLDSITPIIADLPLNYPVYYLLESGVYKLSNLLFYHASIFDYKIIKPIDIAIQNPNILNSGYRHIGLYHGRVNGAVLFNGFGIICWNRK